MIDHEMSQDRSTGAQVVRSCGKNNVFPGGLCPRDVSENAANARLGESSVMTKCVRQASLSAASPDLSSDELSFVYLITEYVIGISGPVTSVTHFQTRAGSVGFDAPATTYKKI